MNKFLKIGVLVVVVLGIFYMGWNIFTANHQTQKTEMPKYQTIAVEEQEPLVLEGNVETEKEQAYVVDPQKGDVASISVTDGQEVAVGDVLFEYENSTVTDEVSDMKRQVARLVEERGSLYEDLEKQESRKNQAATETASLAPLPTTQEQDEKVTQGIPQVDVSAFDQAIEATQKAIREMNHNIEDLNTKISRMEEKATAIVTAEITGTVTLNEEGKTNPQVPLVKITSKNSEIKSTISEYDYESVSTGVPVTIYVKAQDREIKGDISFVATEPVSATASTGISAAASPFSASPNTNSVSRYSVVIKPSESLPNGFTVQVKVPQNGIVLVEKAVQKDGEQEYVYVVDNGIAHRKNIKRTKKGFQWIVTDGITVGESIIINPDDELSDGKAVVTTTEMEKAHD